MKKGDLVVALGHEDRGEGTLVRCAIYSRRLKQWLVTWPHLKTPTWNYESELRKVKVRR